MNINHLKICAWSGPVFAGMFLIAFVFLAGFLPPPSPTLDANAVAELYRENSTSMRISFIIMMLGFPFYVPFVAAIAAQMGKMEKPSPVLIHTFVITTASITALLFVVVVGWAAASFRLDRSPEIIQAFNDYAFLMIIWPGSIIAFSYFPLGLAILSDKREVPVFPRWFGFYNFWMALVLYAGAILLFFKEGPFAWDGLFAFWLPAIAFFGWYIVTSVVLIQSVNREAELNG